MLPRPARSAAKSNFEIWESSIAKRGRGYIPVKETPELGAGAVQDGIVQGLRACSKIHSREVDRERRSTIVCETKTAKETENTRPELLEKESGGGVL